MPTPTAAARLAAPWTEARTLADLGRLTADWLEGNLEGEHPNGYDRPDDETLPMVPALAAACRAGFVTVNSQPGNTHIVDGEQWDQHAEVTGLISDHQLLHRLAEQAWSFGIQIFIHRPWTGPEGWLIPITFCDGEPITFSGHRMPHDEAEVQWEGCHEHAVTAALMARQVTLIDPEVGRPALLDWVLTNAIDETAPARHDCVPPSLHPHPQT